MNIITFSDELTQMITRWKKPVPTTHGTLAPLLTSQEIVDAVRNVLRLTLNSTPDIPDYSPARTPVMGIEIRTPDTPVAPKFDRNSIRHSSIGRYRSLDTLVNPDGEYAITVHDRGPSYQGDDTLGRKDEDDTCEQPTKPIRRLSSIGTRLGTVRPATTSMLPPSPTKQRRSQAVPGTPTSSKFNTAPKVEKTTVSTRRRTIAIPSVNSIPSSSSTRRTLQTTVAPIARSPIVTRNSKYSYIQSTIPKTARAAKKTAK